MNNTKDNLNCDAEIVNNIDYGINTLERESVALSIYPDFFDSVSNSAISCVNDINAVSLDLENAIVQYEDQNLEQAKEQLEGFVVSHEKLKDNFSGGIDALQELVDSVNKKVNIFQNGIAEGIKSSVEFAEFKKCYNSSKLSLSEISKSTTKCKKCIKIVERKIKELGELLDNLTANAAIGGNKWLY